MLLKAEEEQPGRTLCLDEEKNVPCSSSSSSFLLLVAFFFALFII
jgi:hypothetical protein